MTWLNIMNMCFYLIINWNKPRNRVCAFSDIYETFSRHVPILHDLTLYKLQSLVLAFSSLRYFSSMAMHWSFSWGEKKKEKKDKKKMRGEIEFIIFPLEIKQAPWRLQRRW